MDNLKTHGLGLFNAASEIPFELRTLSGVDAILIHVTDDPKQCVASVACRAGCRVIVFTGDPTNAEARSREIALRARFPTARIEMVPLWLLRDRLGDALRSDDLTLLHEDRGAKCADLLNALWILGALWKRDGVVYAHQDGDSGGLKLVDGEQEPNEDSLCLAKSGQRCGMSAIRSLRTPSGKSVKTTVRMIYGHPDDRYRPSIGFTGAFNTVDQPDAFQESLISLRDSLLEWANRPSATDSSP